MEELSEMRIVRGPERLRRWVVACCVVAILGGVTSARAGSPLSNDPSPLALCQEGVRESSIRLATEARRAMSSCLVRGIECLVNDPGSASACCARVAGRCDGAFARIATAARRFDTQVTRRRCATVPFDDVLTGLGYADLAAHCAALDPPVALADLDGLAECLRRVVVAETSCQIATLELPRGAESLACLGLEEAFVDATGADPATCGAAAPAGSPTPTTSATPTVVPTASVIASATPTAVATATRTATPVPTATTTALSSATATPLATVTSTATPTATRTATPQPTSTASPQVPVPTLTATPVATATVTPLPTATPTATPPATATRTATPAPTATRTATPQPTATVTVVVVVPTATLTPQPTATRTATPIPTATRTSTPVPTTTATPSGPVCGNKVVESGEQCDDGNTADCDACPSDCHTAPADCTAQTVRHTQQIRVTGPTELGAVQLCLKYPTGTVGFPGTGAVASRITGFAGSSNLSDFNNAAQIALLPAGSQTQFTATVSFDRCVNAPVPPATAFTCVTKDASDTFGQPIDPPTIVGCVAVAP